MSLSLSGSYSEKAREKENKRHDLLLNKKLRDLEKMRQTVERELTFEQKAVRAELTHQRRPDHRLAVARRGSVMAHVSTETKIQSTSELAGRRAGRRCSLPVNLLPVMNSVMDHQGILNSIEESDVSDKLTRLSSTPPPTPGGRRRSLQPVSATEFDITSAKSKHNTGEKSEKRVTGEKHHPTENG